MEEIDHPISWDEIKKSTTKLANKKSPGLNGFLPNAFKALNEKFLLGLYYSKINPGLSKDDFDKWHEGQVFMLPKNLSPQTPKSG